jgi:hypothetical protein
MYYSTKEMKIKTKIIITNKKHACRAMEIGVEKSDMAGFKIFFFFTKNANKIN